MGGGASTPQVQIIASAAEARVLFGYLASRGYDVDIVRRSRQMASADRSIDAPCLVIASNLPSVGGSLSRFGGTGAESPRVVLIGEPSARAASALERAGVAVVDVCPRPVVAERLVAAVERALLRPIERTEQLALPDVAADAPFFDASGESPVSVSDGDTEWSTRMAVSDRLQHMLEECDRRIFPDAAPIAFRFTVGEESAEELVPPELLETRGLPVDVLQEDPLEGPSPLAVALEPSAARATHSPVLSAVPHHRPATPRGDAALADAQADTEPAASGGVRTTRRSRLAGKPSKLALPPTEPSQFVDGSEQSLPRHGSGALRRGQIVPLLGRAARSRSSVRFAIAVEGEEPLAVELEFGALRSFRGPVLRRAFGVPDTPIEDAPRREQEVALDELADELGLSRFELDRRIRVAREELLFESALAHRGRYEFHQGPPSASPATPPLIAGSVLQVFLRQARNRITREALGEWLDVSKRSFHLQDAELAWLSEAAVDPEILLLLKRYEGRPIEDAFSHAPHDVGLASVVWLLQVLGAS